MRGVHPAQAELCGLGSPPPTPEWQPVELITGRQEPPAIPETSTPTRLLPPFLLGQVVVGVAYGVYKTARLGVEVATSGRRGHRFDIGDRSWQAQANCLGVDPDLFFPERGASTKQAKAVCRACVVQNDCLEYAITNGEKFGIWGGLSERERRRLRRQRALARRPGTISSA